MDRLLNASLQEVLERSATAIAAGQATLLHIGAVRDSVGERWPKRRDQVADFLERTVERIALPSAHLTALNDVEFLLVQPQLPGTAALSMSANILRETLTFFLGKAAREDIQISRVQGFDGHSLQIEAVDPGSPELDEPPPGEPPRRAGAGDAAAAPRSALTWARGNRRGPPERVGDCEIRIVEAPIWNIPARALSSFQLRVETRRAGSDGPFMNLDGPEVSPGVGVAAALLALRQTDGDGPGGGRARMGFHIPIAASCLSYSNSRFRLLNALKAVPAQSRRRLVLEIVGLAEGFPDGRLREFVAMLSPLGRSIVVRSPTLTADLHAMRDCGFAAVTVDCGDLDASDRRAPARLAAFSDAVAAIGLARMACGVETRALMVAAWAAGFTHVCGGAVYPDSEPPDVPVRLNPTDLYPAGA